MIVLVAIAVLVGATNASAGETRVVESTIGDGELALSTNSGVAVNEAIHAIYVADTGHGEIAAFEPNGTPVATFGSLVAPTFIAVDNSNTASQGSVYAVDSGENSVWKFAADGSVESAWGTLGELGGFGAIAGIAVGQTGTVFVLEEGSTVHTYSSAGAEQSSFEAPRGTSVAGLAVDSEDHLYKVDGSPEVTKFNTTGETLSNSLTNREDAVGLAVDLSNDDLYVLNGNGSNPFVSVFAVGCGEVCTPVESFGQGELAQVSGVAVDAALPSIFVADAGADEVAVIGSPVVLPDVTAEAASGVKAERAVLHGLVNPDGVAVTECNFKYGPEGGPTSTVPCEGAIPTDETGHPVEASVVGLEENTTYSVQLAARNANGVKTTSTSFTTGSIATTAPATAMTATGATLNGQVLPEGETVSECFFEYGETTGYGSIVDCEQAVPADEGDHAVSADIAGLTPSGVTYDFRLVVVRPGGEAKGANQSFETRGAQIGRVATVSVGTDEATLGAEVNPRGSATTFHFEYGPDTQYGSETPVVTLGSGGDFVTVVEEVSGLSPATTYHWRIVVESDGEAFKGPDYAFTTFALPVGPGTDCPNQAFRAGPGQYLPDCRAYEQVSPTDKNGSSISQEPNQIEASADGNRFVFPSVAGLPTTGGSAEYFISARAGDGWNTNGLSPTYGPGYRPILAGWDNELRAVFGSLVNNGGTLYTGDTASGTYSQVASSPFNIRVTLPDFAADPQHLIFESERELAPGAVAGRENLYELDHGVLTLAGRVPAGGATSCDDASSPACVPAPSGSFAGPYEWETGNLESGGPYENNQVAGYYSENTISDDGTRIIFTTSGDGRLYLREGGTKTTQISASRRSTPDPEGRKPAAFMTATPDGSKIFFLSCEKLTDDSTAVSGAAESCTEKEAGQDVQGQDLYVYEPDSEQLTDLSVDITASDPRGADVVGVLGASEDGSYVYFAANGVLAPGASPGNCVVGSEKSELSVCNIYLAHEGQVSLVTPIEAAGSGAFNVRTGGAENWLAQSRAKNEAMKSSLVSPNGVLLFSSFQPLTGYDNSCKLHLETGCGEYFRYTPSDGDLQCVSCNRTGAAPEGDAASTYNQLQTFATGVSKPFLTRNLSSDGNKVFFNSPDRLDPRDRNDVVDPYEWEAVGTGSCTTATVDGGCLYLLSTGEDEHPSYVGDASKSGNDVFIFTQQALVPTDRDALVDIYDVRVEGGLATQHSSPPTSCFAEGCKGQVAAPPGALSPGSATFSGPGNRAGKPHKCSRKKSRGKAARSRKCHKPRKHRKHGKAQNGVKSRGADDNRGGAK